MESYHAVARALGVMTMLFVPPPGSGGVPEPRDWQDERDFLLADLRDVILPAAGLSGPVYARHLDEGGPNFPRLQQAAKALIRAYQASQYNMVSQMAPGMLRSAHFHVDTTAGIARREAVLLRGDLLGVIAAYLIQIREHELAVVALHSALKDATEASNRPLAVSCIDRQAWAITCQKRLTYAENICVDVADDIEPKLSVSDPEEIAAWGRILMRASSAAARNNRSQEAREYLEAAAAAANRLGREHEDLAGHRAFGPLSVALRFPENDLVAGKPAEALRSIADLPTSAGKVTPTAWWRHMLDRALALAMTGKGSEALGVLHGVRTEAPEWLRQQRMAQDIVRDVVESGTIVPSAADKGLATFMGIGI